ncbi:MAG: GntR family transcriptional regulator, partial [Betaproteobacteria bacterium HGW-Betaproteobacteria-21]
RALLDALLARDADAADQLMREHIRGGREALARIAEARNRVA